MDASCAAPLADAGLVQTLLASTDCNIQNLSSSAYAALAAPNSPVAIALTTMLTLYVAFIGFRMLLGRAPLRVGDLTVSALKIGVVLVLATSWPTYQKLVFDTLFLGPAELASGMLQSVHGPGFADSTSAFGDLQAAYDEMQLSTLYFNQHSLNTVSPLQGGNAGAAMALTTAAQLMLLTTVGVTVAARIVLGLLLGLGPLFVGFLLFDSTRGLFEGWLRASIAFSLTPLLAALGLGVQLTLITPDLVRLAEMRAGAPINTGPANAIFLLTLISTIVSIALIAAIGLIAKGLRLGSARSTSSREARDGEAARASDISVMARSDAQVTVEPRAASVAAAAAAMERRENRQDLNESSAPRRLEVRRQRTDRETTALGAPPAAIRRSGQPRSAASSLRRDR